MQNNEEYPLAKPWLAPPGEREYNQYKQVYTNDCTKENAMATLKDVAELACVDVSTVSRALNNTSYVHPDTKERIYAAAKELGANTKYTAKQAADAMGFMGMAGWNARQMLSGMPGVLDLAAASGEDLAGVADRCAYTNIYGSTGDVVGSVASNPNAIGYTSLSAVDGTVAALKIGGAVCTEDTVRDGTYPIQRPFLLVTREGAELSGEAQAFLDFALSEAAAPYITKAGAVAP